MAANVLLDSRRVLAEVTQQKLKLAEAKELLQESDYNARSVLNHTKGQCSDLKMTWLELQTRAKIMSYMEQGRDSWPEYGAVDAEVKDAKKKASGLKKEAAQQEKLLSDLAQQASTKYEEHVEKVAKLQERITQVETTQAKLQEVLQKHQTVGQLLNLPQIDHTFDMAALLEQQTSGIKKAEAALSSCQAALLGLQQELAQAMEERDKFLSQKQTAERTREELLSRKEQGTDRIRAQTAWCKQVYKVLSQLSGVEEHSLVGKSLTVKLLPPPDSTCDVIPLLTLHFREQLTGGFALEGAVVDPPSLEIEDLIEVAMETNDALFLVNRVRERFFTQMPLLQEIEGLCHRYAIDYQAAQNRVRVMLGEGGRITCTLDIGRDYPGAEGVCLMDCTGLPDGKTLQDLLPSTSHLMTLEQWMDHLTSISSSW
ncbi:nuclear mitotic apparatus protein 1-like [Branchiostoma lanceolatum]|uniref:nuclear mitotic apparatus protein 1-like n=1 Tax=Branchiostoma lanceolatum TaxID=7740 RepID=UPI0034547B7D